MRRNMKGGSGSTKSGKLKVRILSVDVSVGSLVKADEEMVRSTVPTNWVLRDRIRMPYLRRILLKYTGTTRS